MLAVATPPIAMHQTSFTPRPPTGAKATTSTAGGVLPLLPSSASIPSSQLQQAKSPAPTRLPAQRKLAEVSGQLAYQPQHSPSPLGSAYDEVRIPIDPPHLVAALPAHSSAVLHPQASMPAPHEHVAAALPSAHAIVPLPASFHYPPTAVNLPNILIPPTFPMPSPLLVGDAAAAHHSPNPYTPTSPSNQQTTPMALPDPAPAIAPVPSPSPATPVPSSAMAPFASTSMDSRQWAQLLFKYRTNDTPTPSSRANPVTSNGLNNNAASTSALSSGLQSPAPSAVVSPLYSPNTLASGATARPPSRARSRQGQRPTNESQRPPSAQHEDPEKQAMQNELHRLRAMIAMQTLSAATNLMPPASAIIASPSATPLSAAAQPVMSSPMHTPAPSGPGGPGLRWNTAFAALSTTFNNASPAFSSIAYHPAGSEPSFSALPSPAVTEAPASAHDHRSTFRSMSMLIRSGSAAHSSASSSAANGYGSHFPHPPPPASLLIRSRSAEEPHSMHSTPESVAATPKMAPSASHNDVASLDEIEEDLAPHSLGPTAEQEFAPLTPVGPSSRSVFQYQRQFESDHHEIEEESHLHQTPATNTTGDLSPDAESATDEPAVTSVTIVAPRATTSSTASPSTSSNALPLFFPTSLSRKSPRVCSDAGCVDRMRKEKAELHRIYTEELTAHKTKHATHVKSLEQRFKRDLHQKDQRIAALEKLQGKLAQPHSKLVAQNDELQALVARLKDQLASLGASPLGPTKDEHKYPTYASPATPVSASQEDAFSSLVLPGSAAAASAAAAAASSESDQADSPILSHDVHAPVPEPFFNTSAPRTVTSKTRRRSQSFSSNSSTFQLKLRQLASPAPVIIDAGSTNSPRPIRSNSPATPSRPGPHMPPGQPRQGQPPPRKNSLKSMMTSAAIAAAVALSAPYAESSPVVNGTAAPVTTRPQRQQSRGRAATVGGGH